MKKHRVKMETDKYEMTFKFGFWDSNEETYRKTIWEAEAYVGPAALNRNHIELIHSDNVNNPIAVDAMNNARILKNTNQSINQMKFKP